MGIIEATYPVIKVKPSSLRRPRSPHGCIKHAVREWEVQWVTSPEAKHRSGWGDSALMIALWVPETADASEIGAPLHVLLGKWAEVVRRMDRACSRGNLGSHSCVTFRGRKRYLGDGCTFMNVMEVSEVVSKRQACVGV